MVREDARRGLLQELDSVVQRWEARIPPTKRRCAWPASTTICCVSGPTAKSELRRERQKRAASRAWYDMERMQQVVIGPVERIIDIQLQRVILIDTVF